MLEESQQTPESGAIPYSYIDSMLICLSEKGVALTISDREVSECRSPSSTESSHPPRS